MLENAWSIEDHELEQYVDSLPTLNIDGAKKILTASIAVARQQNVYGFCIVYFRTGMQECSEAVGALARPAHVEIAQAKAATVLNMRKSTRLLAEWLITEREGFGPQDFAGQIPTILPGGVAIFADHDLKYFIGAMAFSGGSPEQDEYVCNAGLERVGFYSDIPVDESEANLRGK